MMHANIRRYKCLYFILVHPRYQQLLTLSNLKKVHMFSQLCFKYTSIFTTAIICAVGFTRHELKIYLFFFLNDSN